MRWWKVILVALLLVVCWEIPGQAGNDVEQTGNDVDVAEILFGHTSDGYGWHITTWKGHHGTLQHGKDTMSLYRCHA